MSLINDLLQYRMEKGSSVRDVGRCLPISTTETNISNIRDVWTRGTASFHVICAQGRVSISITATVHNIKVAHSFRITEVLKTHILRNNHTYIIINASHEVLCIEL